MNLTRLPLVVLYKIKDFFIRQETALQIGKELNVDPIELNKINPNYGDWFVHPCVRYIPEGFAGHRWWMVVTPYPNGNSKYENPVLYYGEGNTEDVPHDWRMVGIVQDTHAEGGYNADGNIYFDGSKLWIIWKENNTDNTIKEFGYRVIMGCTFDGHKFSKPIVVAHNLNETSMYLASPVLQEIDGNIKILGVYSPMIGDNCPGMIKKPRSIAVFSNSSLFNTPFYFDYIAEQDYKKGFDFWHIDCFEGNKKYYCLVTPESGNEILLGESENGLNYKFYNKALLHSNGKQRSPYMYKPSGVLIGDIFHLFYPSKLKDKKRVHIFCTTCSFSKLLNDLKNG